MSTRKLAIVLAAAFAAFLIVPVAAGAQTTPTTTPTTPPTVSVQSLAHVPITGTSSDGKTFTGHFSVSQFIARGGKTYAVGTVTGNLGGKFVKRSNITIPVAVQRGTSTVTPAAVCPILHLVLGPLHLNLLGLHVNLNQVILNITAVSGPGNLLGNLLCGVANLLNGSPVGAGRQAGLLNVLQQLTDIPGILNL